MNVIVAMFKNIILFIVLLTLCEVSSFHMDVKVRNDKGEIVEEYSEEREIDHSLTEELPYKRMIPAEVTHSSDYIKEKGLRFKREFGKQLKELSEGDCSSSLINMKKITEKRAVQLVYVLEPGDNIKMDCDVCGNRRLSAEHITWKKLSRGDIYSPDQYDIVDVKMDMHDDESRNRVYMQNDKHSSLVYKNVTRDDVGTYFCVQSKQMITTFRGFIYPSMTAPLIHRLFSRKYLFNFYYHLDILPVSKAPAVLVSKDGKEYTKPIPPFYDDVFIFYSDWGNWSPCSACGEIGERKRHGVCTVKFNPEIKVKYFNPVFVFHILNSVPKGIPCRSTLFQGFAFKKTRPDEIMIESCNITCRKGPGGIFGGIKIGKVRFKRPVPEFDIKATVGEKVEMKCPGATLNTIVYWINGTKYVPTMVLRQLTSRRAEIDVYGVLIIKSVELIDACSYSCWHHDVKRIVYKLEVNPQEDKGAILRNFGYLCLTFFADFWIFLIMMVIKYKNRRVQVSVYSRAGHKARQNMEEYDDTGMDNYDVDLPPLDDYLDVPRLDNYSDRTSFTVYSDRGSPRR